MRSVQVSKANGPFELIEREDIPEPNATQVRIKFAEDMTAEIMVNEL